MTLLFAHNWSRSARYVRVVYLEQRSVPELQPTSPPGIAVVARHRPSVEIYRSWYRGVGDSYLWTDRLRLTDDALAAAIHAPNVSLYTLEVHEETAGYVELRRDHDDVEIVYFGLFPKFVGRGLGRWFLNWVVQTAWSQDPGRVWLHTCDRDHRTALRNYLKAGFRVYDQLIVAAPKS